MNNFTSRNQAKQPVFTFNSDALEWMDLNQYVTEHGNEPFEVKALFVNEKAKFGARPVVVSPTHKINLPNHMLSDVKEIMADPDLVAIINNGGCVFIPEQYEDKNGVTRNSGTFADKA